MGVNSPVLFFCFFMTYESIYSFIYREMLKEIEKDLFRPYIFSSLPKISGLADWIPTVSNRKYYFFGTAKGNTMQYNGFEWEVVPRGERTKKGDIYNSHSSFVPAMIGLESNGKSWFRKKKVMNRVVIRAPHSPGNITENPSISTKNVEGYTFSPNRLGKLLEDMGFKVPETGSLEYKVSVKLIEKPFDLKSLKVHLADIVKYASDGTVKRNGYNLCWSVNEICEAFAHGGYDAGSITADDVIREAGKRVDVDQDINWFHPLMVIWGYNIPGNFNGYRVDEETFRNSLKDYMFND